MAIVIQSGRLEKTTDLLIIDFPVAFTGTPHVVISGHWDGSPTFLDRPDIIQDIDTDSFKVYSPNRSQPAGGYRYYINWMARGDT